MNLIINPSQPPGYTRPINNGSTRFALPIPGRSRLKPELEKTPAAAGSAPPRKAAPPRVQGTATICPMDIWFSFGSNGRD
jgi:hypothetical protein